MVRVITSQAVCNISQSYAGKGPGVPAEKLIHGIYLIFRKPASIVRDADKQIFLFDNMKPYLKLSMPGDVFETMY